MIELEAGSLVDRKRGRLPGRSEVGRAASGEVCDAVIVGRPLADCDERAVLAAAVLLFLDVLARPA